jgi:peptidoglycan hydrolase-like protein with peptidoglycan-binding domain
MKRALLIAAAAAIACASQQRTSSDETYRSSRDTASGETTVVQPSSLSPEQVRLVQRSLADRGFAVDMNGRFDGRTQQALTDFQRARGLPSTGNLNPPTVEALGLDPRDVMPVRGSSGDAAATTRDSATSSNGDERGTKDPNPEGSLRQNAPPSHSSSGSGTNTGTPTAPVEGSDRAWGTGSRQDDAQRTGPRDINPEGSLRQNATPSHSSSGAGTNVGGPTAPTHTAPGDQQPPPSSTR